MKNIAILGSTGSIGINTLDVIGNNPGHFKIVALTAGKNIALLGKQIKKYKPEIVSVVDEEHAFELKRMINSSMKTEILFGENGYCEAACVQQADMVISAMVGSAGLLPTIEAISAGKDIALANKEVMVMAGSLVGAKAREKGVKIFPVDSEHSAIFQCIEGHRKKDIKKIILTASGGPFLHFSKEELAKVKPAQALKHPNWQMGRKITIDSASMMNKGLEIIEAMWLFSVDIDSIEVLIHPQSIVHSMVEYVDGSILAQLSVPDMRIPIAYALSFPERIPRKESFVDLVKVGRLEFHKPDVEKFPNLRLAYEAGKSGETMPAVLNAANEVAVEAFLAESIKFTDISRVIEEVLSRHHITVSPTLDEIRDADLWARDCSKKIVERMRLSLC